MVKSRVLQKEKCSHKFNVAHLARTFSFMFVCLCVSFFFFFIIYFGVVRFYKSNLCSPSLGKALVLFLCERFD